MSSSSSVAPPRLSLGPDGAVARYELEVDPESIPGLVERFGLRFPGEPI